MVDIVKQIIAFYLKNNREPMVNDITVIDTSLLNNPGAVFVTVYRKGEIRGSGGNIKEIDASIFHELIKNTIFAISKDDRFDPLTLKESTSIVIRVDLIKDREVLQDGELSKVDPIKNGIIVIKKDYEKLGVILPNINPLIMNGADYPKFLTAKLGEQFNEKDYIIYKINTEIDKDY